jgi:hypothetical protein
MEKEQIVIGIGARPAGEPMSEDLGMAEEADAEMFEAMAPTGDFTSRGLDPLVRSTNRLLPLFGQTADYPMVEDTSKLPVDFTRILAMFSAAAEDAIAQDIIREEMKLDLESLRDDTSLITMAGKLDMLSKDKDFKRFLSEPAPEEEPMGEEMGEEMGEQPMSMEDEDAYLMGRM